MNNDTPGERQTTDDSAVNRKVRPAHKRRRTFIGILANTAVANITTSYLWFALTFWIYIETRNVIATGVVGGTYMLLVALSSISFGTFVDRFRKLTVMRFAGGFTLIMFLLAGGIYLATPDQLIADLTLPWFWIFGLVILIGAVVEQMRNIALSTTVTILIDPDDRAKANGLVGMVQGIAFMFTSVLSGLSIGFLGMGNTVSIATAFSALAFIHLFMVSTPEEVKPATSDAQGSFDLRGSWRAVMGVSGLIALIIFSTFNNFIGGVYMALMDPYGLELFRVEVWGALFALASTGFIVGGAIIGRTGLGANPLRTMLLAVIGMGVLGAIFTIRELGWLYMVCIWLYMALFPAVEAGEQTVIQRVVPLARQGRVFGFAMAFESGAAPITAFLVAPIAELWIIPWARSESGSTTLEPLLGTGDARGIALIFLVAGVIMIIAAVAAFFTPVYRRVSASYASQVAADRAAADTPA